MLKNNTTENNAIKNNDAKCNIIKNTGNDNNGIDEMPNHGFDMSAQKGTDWFWEIIRYFSPMYKHVAIASLMVNIFALAMPLFVMNVYDRIVPNSAFESLFVLSVGIFIVFVFDLLLRNARSYFIEFAGRNADVLLLGKFMDTISTIRLDAIPSTSLGAFLAKVREFEYVREFMGATSLIALLDLPFIMLFVGLIGLLGGTLVFVPLCAIPTLFIFSWILQKKFEKSAQNQLANMAKKNALLGEIASGFETVRATRLDTALTKRWDLLVDKAALSNAQAKLLGVKSAHANLFINSIFSVILVIYGVFLIDAGSMSMGALIACVILLGRTLAPLSGLVNVASNFHKARLGLKSMHAVMQMPQEGGSELGQNTDLVPAKEWRTEKWNVENSNNDATNTFIEFATQPAEPKSNSQAHIAHHTLLQQSLLQDLPQKVMHADIRFDNVSFKYPAKHIQHYSLTHINLTIYKGDRVGIIGKSGSGKSTLARLVAGLYLPTEGHSFYGSSEYAFAPMRKIRENMGVLPQQVVLFSGTVRSNICDAWPVHVPLTEEALIRIATIAGVMDFVSEHPLGLDMPIQEHGVGLSGGQAQAVGLARALAGDPDILILDEPTSHLDTESEKLLVTRLLPYLAHRTVIILTHRTSLLQIIDRLIVMSHGHIIKDVPLRHTVASYTETAQNDVVQNNAIQSNAGSNSSQSKTAQSSSKKSSTGENQEQGVLESISMQTNAPESTGGEHD